MIRFPENFWTPDDAVKARDYFGSTSGQKMISLMKSNTPKIEGKDRDERYDASIKMQTWNEAIDSLAEFTTSPQHEQGERIETVEDIVARESRKRGET
jgi:hypothetical protein